MLERNGKICKSYIHVYFAIVLMMIMIMLIFLVPLFDWKCFFDDAHSYLLTCLDFHLTKPEKP